jgi:methylenetetrahydrofolate reductase (NADPH)
VSVTYGAAGNTPHFTRELSQTVQAFGVPALSHLTCINDTKSKIADVLDDLQAAGMTNGLALRGDIPEGGAFPGEDHFRHASELVAAIKERGGFCVGAACYPEGHPEAPSRDQDLNYLRQKVDAGTDFLTTQMFFDNNILYNFLYRALQKGITLPVCAGIMPVVNARQIKRITALSGAGLPPRFAAIVDRFGGDPASMREAGIAYATEQIIDLIANGVSRIHLYTMNRPDIAAAIFGNLRAIIGGNTHG